jgi:hypothetical protein
MRHRRHTITVASSTLFFVCLALHAQTGPHSRASTSYSNAEARKVYESLLPAVAFNRATFISSAFNPAAFQIAATVAVLDTGHTPDLLSSENTSYVLESKDGLWNSRRWRSTSRAWAS